jgi:hypothetical protein
VQHRLKRRDLSLRLSIAGPFLMRSVHSAVIDSMPRRLMPAMLLPWKLHCSGVRTREFRLNGPPKLHLV